MKLGERLYGYRKERGMSQFALAEQLGILQSTVSEVEHSRYVPIDNGSWRYMVRWIQALSPKGEIDTLLNLLVDEAILQYSERVKRLIYGKK